MYLEKNISLHKFKLHIYSASAIVYISCNELPAAKKVFRSVPDTEYQNRKKSPNLRKKSHILVARYLADQMPANQSLQSHRKAFCLGSILPDIQPSFVTKRHEYYGTFEEVRGKMQRLVNEGAHDCNGRVFWRRTGEILHYIADYFTFPHNRTFDGSFRQHNSYEKRLKNEMKAFVESGRADIYTVTPLHFDDFNCLVEYIRSRHAEYLQCKRNIQDDIKYILTVCFQVFQGIFQLCLKAFPAGVPAFAA